MFLAGAAVNIVIAPGVFALAAARKSLRLPVTDAASDDASESSEDQDQAPRLTVTTALTITAMLLLVCAGVLLKTNIGLLAVSLAVVLGLFRPGDQKKALAEVPWSVVMLVCRIVTYIGLLKHLGTLDPIGRLAEQATDTAVAILLVCHVAAIVSAFASSTGAIAAMVPILIPVHVGSGLSATLAAAMVGGSATIVDVSPLSINGAIVLASSPERERTRMFRIVLGYGGTLVLVGPLIIWACTVLPN